MENQLSGRINLKFQPNRLVRNRHLQTVVTSFYHRQPVSEFQRTTHEMMLTVDEGVRLIGYYSPQPVGQTKGLFLLLHGWLGCADSNYMVEMSDYFYQKGYAIFRLNFRDHGGSHHLNAAPFRADRLEEAFIASRQIAELAGDQLMYIVGMSLGGNFALRLAWCHSQRPIANLGQTIAICPAINPYHSALALDRNPIYLTYFRRRWRRAMRAKMQAFPDSVDFSAELTASTCLAMHECFVRNHSPYPNARTYFDQYAIKPALMSTLTSPTTIITAADDPIIPVTDFAALDAASPNLHVSIQPYGGHVGFMDILPYRNWVCQAVEQILAG